MALKRSFKLNSGYEIPAIGLGTWQSKPNEVKDAVSNALRIGYRHIDAAACYENEEEVGAGIKESGVPRQEIFLTSKLWNTHHAPEHVEEALDKSLKDLQTDYLDLYLIHWPVAFRYGSTIQPLDPETCMVDTVDVPIADTWAVMEKLVEKGKVRSIGVSNFSRARIEELLKTAKIRPALNQIEAHPYLQQRDLLAWSRQQDIVVAGYSPLGNNIYNIPRVVDDPIVLETAASINTSPAQLLISWAVQRGTVVLPKSVTKERIQSNFEDFELDPATFEKIQSLERHLRMNYPIKTGVDIFGEVGEEAAKEGARTWAQEQRRLKAASAAAAPR